MLLTGSLVEIPRRMCLWAGDSFGNGTPNQIIESLRLPQDPNILYAQIGASIVFLAHRALHKPLLDEDSVNVSEMLAAHAIDAVQGLSVFLAPAIVVNFLNHSGDVDSWQYVAGAVGIVSLGIALKGFIPNREKGGVENEAVVTEVEKPNEKNKSIDDGPNQEQVELIARFYMEKGMPEAKAKERAMNYRVHRSQ